MWQDGHLGYHFGAVFKWCCPFFPRVFSALFQHHFPACWCHPTAEALVISILLKRSSCVTLTDVEVKVPRQKYPAVAPVANDETHCRTVLTGFSAPLAYLRHHPICLHIWKPFHKHVIWTWCDTLIWYIANGRYHWNIAVVCRNITCQLYILATGLVVHLHKCWFAWFCDCFYVCKRPFWRAIVGNEVIKNKYSIMKKSVAFRKCCSNLQSTQVSNECETLNVNIHF